MNKINVLHMFSSDTIGGAEKQTLLTAISFKQLSDKFEAIVAAPKKSFLYEEAEKENVKVVDFECRAAFTPTGVFRLIKIIKKEKIKILHVHQGKLYWTALLMKLFYPKIKVILHRRQDTRHKWLASFHYRLADKTVSVSKAIKDNLVKYEKVPENKIDVLYNGFDTQRFEQVIDCNDIIKQYNLENKFVIGTVGAIVSLEGKGQQYLIEAVKQLRIKYPNIVALIVGDGAGKKLQQEYAKKLGVEDIVVFTGYQSEIPKFLKTMNIFCLLSCGSEGFGNVNLEAESLKIPVITTNIGGIPETVIDGVTGFIIEPRNVEQLVNNIEKIILDKKLAESMGEAGYKFVKETFSKQKYVSNLTTIYENVLND